MDQNSGKDRSGRAAVGRKKKKKKNVFYLFCTGTEKSERGREKSKVFAQSLQNRLTVKYAKYSKCSVWVLFARVIKHGTTKN